MKGKLLTEGQLRELADYTRVYLVYEVFDPAESDGYSGPAYVEHMADGTQTNLNIGGPLSDPSVTYEYQGEDPDQICDSGPRDDGDCIQIYEWVDAKKVIPGVKHSNPDWKQANPRDQVVAILMSVEGILSNAVDGIYEKNSSTNEQIKRAMNQLQTAQGIIGDLPEGTWLDAKGKRKKIQ